MLERSAKGDDQSSAPPPPTAVSGSIPEDADPPAEVVIQGEREEGQAASRIHVGHRELELRPRLRPADILEAMPGLFAVQHAGGGKANQYFLRGFDADHGTDVAFFLDGVPINMVSHGHGQGFTDFHFLIPELALRGRRCDVHARGLSGQCWQWPGGCAGSAEDPDGRHRRSARHRRVHTVRRGPHQGHRRPPSHRG
jgi:hypothetical protein